jgi:hypothetical protein
MTWQKGSQVHERTAKVRTFVRSPVIVVEEFGIEDDTGASPAFPAKRILNMP